MPKPRTPSAILAAAKVQAPLSAVPDEVSVLAALDTLLNWYVRQRDWFMAERLAHDIERLNSESDSTT